jgi:hypothetical protein
MNSIGAKINRIFRRLSKETVGVSYTTRRYHSIGELEFQMYIKLLSHPYRTRFFLEVIDVNPVRTLNSRIRKIALKHYIDLKLDGKI